MEWEAGVVVVVVVDGGGDNDGAWARGIDDVSRSCERDWRVGLRGCVEDGPSDVGD